MGALFMTIAPAAVVTGVLIDNRGGRLPYLVALVALAILSGIFVFDTQFAVSNLVLMGALAGIANTAFYLTAKIVSDQVVPAAKLNSFNARFSNFIVGAYLVAPLTLIAAKSVFGYQELVLVIASISAVIGATLLLPLKELNAIKNPLNFSLFSPFNKENDERKSLLLFSIVMGLKEGIFWAFFSVVTLLILGSISYWGIVTFCLKLTSMIVNHFLGKLKTITAYEQLMLGLAIAYLGLIVVVMANVSVFAFLVFAFADAIITPVIRLFYAKMNFEITRLDARYSQKVSEYGVFSEIGMTIGRLASLVLLAPVFLAGVEQNDIAIIMLTFMLIGATPLLIIKIAKGSRFLSENSGIDGFRYF